MLRILHLCTTLLLFCTLLCLSSHCPSATKTGRSDLSIVPIYGKCSPFNPSKSNSWVDNVVDMASKDPERMTYLVSLLAGKKAIKVPIASGQNVLHIGNYVVRAKIGTPGQLMFMVLDISNDAAWLPCSGCTGCTSSTFSPNASTSFGALECAVPECAQVKGLSCPATGTGECFLTNLMAVTPPLPPPYLVT